MIGSILARKAVKSAIDALNKRDLEKFMSGWSDDGVWVFPGFISVSGTFTGKESVRKWFQNFQDQFPTRKFTVSHIGVGSIFAFGTSNIISAQWDLDLVNKAGESWKSSGVTVLRIKGAKVVHGQDFLGSIRHDDFKRLWGE